MKTVTLQPHQGTRYFGFTLHAIGVAITAVLIGLCYVLVFKPLDNSKEQYLSRTEQLDALLQSNASEVGDYRRLRSQLDEMKHSVAELHSQLAEEFTEESLLARLNEIAAVSGIQILDHQIGEPQTLLTHSLTEVEFHCHGSYDSICRFLEQAEQITKIARLSKLELDPRDNSRSYPVQLTFVLYSGGKSNDKREKRGV